MAKLSTRIHKAVIPAAGFGTRFLPQTKAMPKEMLPIVDKPVIQYVVEELVASGITDIVIVTGWHKRSIEDHFDYPFELIKMLEQQKKEKLLDEVKRTAGLANFIYIRQKGPYGNGTPVLCAKSVIGNEPFVAIWGDEFIYSTPPGPANALRSLKNMAIRSSPPSGCRKGMYRGMASSTRTISKKTFGRSKID